MKAIMKSSLLAAILMGVVNVGCIFSGRVDYDADYDYVPYADAAEDTLYVSGKGEIVTIEYNELAFSAQVNWQDGNYYFGPDPDEESGYKIVCVADISDEAFQGDCFRQGKVCHFNYYNSYSDVDGKDAYYLSSTSCKKAGNVGPFLVPLEAPLCGQDPFPACPDESMFPTGVNIEYEDYGTEPIPAMPVDEEYGTEPIPAMPVDEADEGEFTSSEIIQALCTHAAHDCHGDQDYQTCLDSLSGGAGQQIFDNFGLVVQENEFDAAAVDQGLADGSIVVDLNSWLSCQQEWEQMTEDCSYPAIIDNLGDIENIIPESGACTQVLTLITTSPVEIL